MSLRRQVAKFFLKGLGLRKLHGGKIQKLARAVLDAIDLQHLRDSQPCPTFSNRLDMWQHVQDLHVRGPVDYLEFGVFEGESIRWWTDEINKHAESRFYGFDSFEGLPVDWHEGKTKGHFSVQGQLPKIDDRRVCFVKGWFSDTIPPFVREFSPKNTLVLHIDCDLYGGAMLALVHFTHLMRPGTILMFDEFFDRDNEFKAFQDWQRIYGKDVQLIGKTPDDGYGGQVCMVVR